MRTLLRQAFSIVVPIVMVVIGVILVSVAFYILPVVLVVMGIRYVHNRRALNTLMRSTESSDYVSTPPDGLRPIELGILLDYALSHRELISILMYLVHMRVIRLEINEPKRGMRKGSYTLTLLEPSLPTLRTYERTFIKHLFGSQTSVYWDSFLEHELIGHILGDITFQAMQELHRQGYLYISKEYADLDYQTAKRAALTSPRKILESIWNVGLGLSAYRTQKATAILPRIQAFCKYLKVAEKDRAAFHTNPQKYGIYVDEYFPYLLAFDMTPQWGDELLGITWEPANGSQTDTYVRH